MREPNCFPPAEHNPSSLTPTSSSQPPVALQELLCLRPQLIPDSPGLFRDVPCLHCTPAAPPLPSTSRTSSSSPCCCLICASFRPLAPHKHLTFSQQIPAIFTFQRGKLLSSHCSSSQGLPLCQAAQRCLSLSPCIPRTSQGRGILPALPLPAAEDPEALPHVWQELCLGKCDTLLKH